MKRNVLCFSILCGFVLIISICEIVYSNMLFREIDEVITLCEGSELTLCNDICKKLKQNFESREILNELFLSRKLIDKVNQSINNLVIYSGYGNRMDFDRSLNVMRICNKDIYYAGVF